MSNSKQVMVLRTPKKRQAKEMVWSTSNSTKQAWSIKNLLYGFRGNFSCGTRRVVPSGQNSSILPARVTNHSAGRVKPDLGHGSCSFSYFLRCLFSGQVLTYENIQEVIKFCAREKLVLLADEVYQENVYADGAQFHSCKKVVRDLGEEYSKFQLISLHSSAKGYTGE